MGWGGATYLPASTEMLECLDTTWLLQHVLAELSSGTGMVGRGTNQSLRGSSWAHKPELGRPPPLHCTFPGALGCLLTCSISFWGT